MNYMTGKIGFHVTESQKNAGAFGNIPDSTYSGQTFNFKMWLKKCQLMFQH